MVNNPDFAHELSLFLKSDDQGWSVIEATNDSNNFKLANINGCRFFLNFDQCLSKVRCGFLVKRNIAYISKGRINIREAEFIWFADEKFMNFSNTFGFPHPHPIDTTLHLVRALRPEGMAKLGAMKNRIVEILIKYPNVHYTNFDGTFYNNYYEELNLPEGVTKEIKDLYNNLRRRQALVQYVLSKNNEINHIQEVSYIGIPRAESAHERMAMIHLLSKGKLIETLPYTFIQDN